LLVNRAYKWIMLGKVLCFTWELFIFCFLVSIILRDLNCLIKKIDSSKFAISNSTQVKKLHVFDEQFLKT